MAIAPRGFLHLWVQQAPPGALAQTFASHMAPGDPSGRTLSVSVKSVYLRRGGPADPDPMRGVATRARRGPARTTRLRATSTYIPSPVDQVLVEQAFKGRVTAPLAGLRLLAREATSAVKPERGRKSNGQ